MNYNHPVFEVIKSKEFIEWVVTLKDRLAATRIAARLDRVSLGNLGDFKSLRDGVSEMRIDVGAGYRLYFTRRGSTVIVLLCGGGKRTQDADIDRAVEMARIWKEEP